MKEKDRRKKLNTESNLKQRAQKINEKYFDGTLEFSIQFVTNQTRKYGSCSPHTKSIRISDKIADLPQFVQDYLIIHELTHLIHPNHSKAFWDMVHRYPLVERAKGFLYAVEFLSKKKKKETQVRQ